MGQALLSHVPCIISFNPHAAAEKLDKSNGGHWLTGAGSLFDRFCFKPLTCVGPENRREHRSRGPALFPGTGAGKDHATRHLPGWSTGWPACACVRVRVCVCAHMCMHALLMHAPPVEAEGTQQPRIQIDLVPEGLGVTSHTLYSHCLVSPACPLLLCPGERVSPNEAADCGGIPMTTGSPRSCSADRDCFCSRSRTGGGRGLLPWLWEVWPVLAALSRSWCRLAPAEPRMDGKSRGKC